MANTCEFVVGRLLEIRVNDEYRTLDDAAHMIDMIRSKMQTLGIHEQVVIAADWRYAQVMPQETAERSRRMLLESNPRVIRSAILTKPESASTNLQVMRLLREAENPERRAFTDPFALAVWLSKVLTPNEQKRLRAFLSLPP